MGDYDFVKELNKILRYEMRDKDGGFIGTTSGISDFKAEYREDDEDMTSKTNETLIEIQEKLSTMSNAINNIEYLIDDVLEDQVEDRNLDLKVIVALNRIENELDECYSFLMHKEL